MAERVQKQKTSARRESAPDSTESKAGSTRAAHDEAVADIDALLDEIDGILEENAEAFVQSYIQKGGQAVRVVLDFLLRPFGQDARFRIL